MNISDVQAMNDAVTKSAQDQQKQIESMLDAHLDASDRISLRKAADAIVDLSKVMALVPDPTT